MKELGYDAKKMPLGKLGDDTINQAYKILNELLQEVKKKKLDTDAINKLNSIFFSLIPHDFGFSKMQNHVMNKEE